MVAVSRRVTRLIPETIAAECAVSDRHKVVAGPRWTSGETRQAARTLISMHDMLFPLLLTVLSEHASLASTCIALAAGLRLLRARAAETHTTSTLRKDGPFNMAS